METKFEKKLTTSHKVDMIAYVSKHPECFPEIIRLIIEDKQPYSWRAAWLLWSCMHKNDPRVKKYVRKLIHILPARQDNQQREILKILHLIDIPGDLEGALFDHCVTIWEKANKQPSVRFNAFRMLSIIAKKHPGLSSEIKALTRNQYTESLSPGVVKSISRMMKDIV